jgi:hypothetical protein
METRNVKISLETAQRWYNGTDDELKELALQTYPEIAKKTLPKSWEELEVIKGCYVSSFSKILDPIDNSVLSLNYKVFKTENQAKSTLAMAKLSQLMAVYNDGWVPDWKNTKQKKYIIYMLNDNIAVDWVYSQKYFLSFKTENLREEFLENFKEDIETYFNF